MPNVQISNCKIPNINEMTNEKVKNIKPSKCQKLNWKMYRNIKLTIEKNYKISNIKVKTSKCQTVKMFKMNETFKRKMSKTSKTSKWQNQYRQCDKMSKCEINKCQNVNCSNGKCKIHCSQVCGLWSIRQLCCNALIFYSAFYLSLLLFHSSKTIN